MALISGTLLGQELDQAYAAVIQLKTQKDGVLHCVSIRPEKIHKPSGLIRLGDSPGDEAAGWQHPANVFIVAVLGVAKIIGTSPADFKTEITPLTE